jgi:radical SAM superfamily enzyme YgiQ (UPF0313 family)
MATDIVLTAINARYVHPSFGARCLLANMGELRPRTRLLEFDLRVPAADIAAEILAEAPRIVGLGVYVWNLERVRQVLSLVKGAEAGPVCVVGGPEVGFGTGPQAVVEAADYALCGEADAAFADLCRAVLSGHPPTEKLHPAPLPDLATLRMPYTLYEDEDLAHRLVYVETSRGCPYRCTYCLSALEERVRTWPLEACLAAFDDLLNRGARRFKFVDRTFNLDFDRCTAVMDFFLARHRPGLEVHFEMVPTRFPADVRDRLRRFPPGSLRLEVGVQTFAPDVARRIERPQDNRRIEDTFRFLREETTALVHADLIAGLPGESLASFGAGFDRLLAMGPREIQVGLLKRLRGAPIVRQEAAFEMAFDDAPPYPLLHSRDLDPASVQRLDRFARYWERLANRGRFPRALPLLWENGASPFQSFLGFSDWLYRRLGRTHTVTLDALAEALWDYLVEACRHPQDRVSAAIVEDYTENGRRRSPAFLGRKAGAHAQGGG